MEGFCFCNVVIIGIISVCDFILVGIFELDWIFFIEDFVVSINFLFFMIGDWVGFFDIGGVWVLFGEGNLEFVGDWIGLMKYLMGIVFGLNVFFKGESFVLWFDVRVIFIGLVFFILRFCLLNWLFFLIDWSLLFKGFLIVFLEFLELGINGIFLIV